MTATTTNTVWIQDDTTAPFALRYEGCGLVCFSVYGSYRHTRFCKVWNNGEIEWILRYATTASEALLMAQALTLAATIASNMDEWRARAQGVTNG